MDEQTIPNDRGNVRTGGAGSPYTLPSTNGTRRETTAKLSRFSTLAAPGAKNYFFTVISSGSLEWLTLTTKLIEIWPSTAMGRF